MEKRCPPFINKKISLLGFGCMRLPLLNSEDPASIDYDALFEMVDAAIKGGINYFDTAWPYHAGKSELALGRALSSYPRDSIFLADKIPTWMIKSQDDAKRIFAEQLTKCQVDYFDFYLMHSLNADHYKMAKQTALYDFLVDMKEQGLIGCLGFSFHDSPQLLQQIISDHAWDFVQLQINYVDWKTLDACGQYEIASQNNLPVIIMEPVRGGALAALNNEAHSILKQYAPQATPASWALRFAGSLSQVMTVLSGMSSLQQMLENIATFTNFKLLTKEEHIVLDKAREAFLSSGAIPCTGCRYCMACPSGVDIPRNFAVYNQYCTGMRIVDFDNSYRTLTPEQQAHNCSACNKCVELCPQKINIPGMLQKVVELAKEAKSARTAFMKKLTAAVPIS